MGKLRFRRVRWPMSQATEQVRGGDQNWTYSAWDREVTLSPLHRLCPLSMGHGLWDHGYYEGHMTSHPPRSYSTSFFHLFKKTEFLRGVVNRFHLHDKSLWPIAWNKALSCMRPHGKEYPLLTGNVCYGCRRGKGQHIRHFSCIKILHQSWRFQWHPPPPPTPILLTFSYSFPTLQGTVLNAHLMGIDELWCPEQVMGARAEGGGDPEVERSQCGVAELRLQTHDSGLHLLPCPALHRSPGLCAELTCTTMGSFGGLFVIFILSFLPCFQLPLSRWSFFYW